MAKAKITQSAKKTTKKVSKKETVAKKVTKKVPTAKVAKTTVKKSTTTPAAKTQEVKMNAASMIELYQANTAKDLRLKKSKEDIVNSCPDFFEAVMRTLFIAGFEVSKLDPALRENRLENLPYGNFYMRLSHKNFNKLSGEGYTPNLFLMITNDCNRIVVAKYCIHFHETDTTILMPANLRGDWNFNWNQKKREWYLVTQPKIQSFLDKLPELITFIERMKAKKINEKEMEAVKKDIVTEFMNPSRINGRKLLWSKSDKAEFFHKPIYPKEKTLFEAVANVIALFTAEVEKPGLRKSVSPRNGKEYIYYKYCEPEIFDKKDGKLLPDDIHDGKLAVPLTFSRRTYFTFSNITECVNKHMSEGLELNIRHIGA